MSRPIRLAPPSPAPSRDRAEHWDTQANCATDKGRRVMDMAHDREQWWDEAKTFCADCPVQTECLAASLHEPLGIWGGLDPDERAALRGDTPAVGYTRKVATMRVCGLAECDVAFPANGPKKFCMRSHQLRHQNRIDKKRVRDRADKRKGDAA